MLAPCTARFALSLALAAFVLLPSTVPAQAPSESRLIILESLHLEVLIHDSVGTTQVSLALFNPTNASQEASVALPLPHSAVLTNLTLTTHNRTYEGGVHEKAVARIEYEVAKAQAKSAVLLTSAGRGLLSLSVNVAPGTTARLNATYVELLPVLDAAQAYRFPLASLLSASGEIRRLSVHFLAEQGVGWDAAAIAGIEDRSLAITNRTVEYVLAPRPFDRAADFHIRLSPKVTGVTTSLLLTGRDGDASAIFTLLLPGGRYTSHPKDIVFVLDRSGSMEGSKIAQAKAALEAILPQLDPRDRFGLLNFDDVIESFDTKLAGMDAARVADAIAWTRNITDRGGTNIHDAVRAALDLLASTESSRVPVIVLITDGEPTVGITDPGTIIASVTEANGIQARIHTVGIGFDQDHAFLTELARANRGLYEPIPAAANVTLLLEGFYERISRVLLRDVSVVFENAEVTEVHPRPLTDVYEGGQLILAGRLNASRLPDVLHIRVEGTSFGGPETHRIDLAAAGLRIVPEARALWARQKASTLERTIQLSDNLTEKETARLELRRHGLAEKIETQETSWVIATRDGLEASAEAPLEAERGPELRAHGVYRMAVTHLDEDYDALSDPGIRWEMGDGKNQTDDLSVPSPAARSPGVGVLVTFVVAAWATARLRRR